MPDAGCGASAPPGGRWVSGAFRRFLSQGGAVTALFAQGHLWPCGGRRTGERAVAQGHPYGGYREGQQVRGNGRGRSPAPTGLPEVSAAGRWGIGPYGVRGTADEERGGGVRSPRPTEGTREADRRVGLRSPRNDSVFVIPRSEATWESVPFPAGPSPLHQSWKCLRAAGCGHPALRKGASRRGQGRRYFWAACWRWARKSPVWPAFTASR